MNDHTTETTRRPPAEFVAAAVFWVLAAAVTSDIRTVPMSTPGLWPVESYPFLNSVTGLSLAAATAPLVALRLPRTAVVVALIPFVLALTVANVPAPGGQRIITIGMFCALLGAGFVAVWRSTILGWLIGALSLVVQASWVFDTRVIMHIYGDVSVFSLYEDTRARLTTMVLYVVGIALVLAVAMALRSALLVREREAALARRDAQMDAREVLAQDLHDVVGHHISLVAVRAETAPYSHPDLSEDARELLAEIAEDARAAMNQMRQAVALIKADGEAPRMPQPTPGDLPVLIEEARAAGTQVMVAGYVPELDEVAAPTVYRVVQEALTNARRHAPGEPVHLELTDDRTAIHVQVSNLVRGTVGPEGTGLSGMRERVERAGGTLEVHQDGGRFVVEALVPGSLGD